MPVTLPKYKLKNPAPLDFEDNHDQRKPNAYINEMRLKAAAWRQLGDAGLGSTVTLVAARLLWHSRNPSRTRKLRFRWIEAGETVIWATEVAPNRRQTS